MSSESVQPNLGRRTIRAVTEYMSVIEEGPAIFSVSTQSGSEYTVDLREGICSCPDYRNREPEGGCKHLRRTRMEMGQVDVESLESELKRTASELEMSADELESKAQEISEQATEVEIAIERLQEVGR